MVLPEGWSASRLCDEVRRSICCVGHISVHLSSLDIFCICPLLSLPLLFPSVLPTQFTPFYTLSSISHSSPHQHHFFCLQLCWCPLLIFLSSPSSLLFPQPVAFLITDIPLQSMYPFPMVQHLSPRSCCYPHFHSCSVLLSRAAGKMHLCPSPPDGCHANFLLPGMVLLTSFSFTFFLPLFLEWVSCPLPHKKSAFSSGTELSRGKMRDTFSFVLVLELSLTCII